jgi:hypothetical protein
VAGSARSSAVTKSGWIGGGVFAPCFAVSRGVHVDIGMIADVRYIAERTVLWEYVVDRVDNGEEGESYDVVMRFDN